MSAPENNVTVSGAGVGGLSGLLGLAFIVLKLTHVIDWSWWWVLAPIWLTFGASLILALICLALVLLIERR